jgi:hypothetical protein
MEQGAWLGISSLVVSLAVLIFGLIQYKQVARKDYVDELSARVDKCEEDRAECERARLVEQRARLVAEERCTEMLIESRASADERIALMKEIQELRKRDL